MKTDDETDEIGDVVFSGSKKGKSLSNGSMLRVLDRMGCGELTVHGFRATFKTWAGECTNFPSDVVKLASRTWSAIEL